ncbi:MAG: DUF58 domain-containing protein [Lachnospiraceae bacterium]|nr:DUF58 domain-containing protein [Lachnospiraceae bacterium]
MILNWVLYLLIMGMLTVGATIFTERIFVVMLVFGLMVPIVSLFVVLLLRRKFVAVLHADTEACHAGERFRFHVSVTNHGRVPCGHAEITVTNEDMLFDDSDIMQMRTAVAGRSKSRCDLYLYVTHCGRLQLTLRSVRLYAPFGLFATDARIEHSVTAFDVYPDEVEVTVSPVRENPYAYIAEEEYSTTRPGDDPSEVFGVREYRPGDKQNRIHWNLTAARDELIVKELGLPIDTSTLLLVDCYELPRRNGEEIYDALMTTVAALARNMIGARRIFYLAWVNESGNAWRYRVSTEEDFLLALTQIFEMRPTERTTSVTSLYASLYAKERYRNILYATTELTPAAEAGLAQLRYDSNVTVYEIKADTAGSAAAERLRNALRGGSVVMREDGYRIQTVHTRSVSADLNAE